MANLAQMTAYAQIILQQQLTDQQLWLLFNMAQTEEVEGWAWGRLKTDITVNSFASYTTGSVAVTQGSPTVVGTGTTFTTAMIGMVFRCGVAGAGSSPSTQFSPIRIDSVTSATQLTLATPYPQTSASGLGFQIFPLFYTAVGLKEILGVRQQVPLKRRTHEFINFIDPYRINLASPSIFWAPAGSDHNDNAMFELYPTETSANGYTVYGMKLPQVMRNPTDIPQLPSAVVLNKGIMKGCETLFSLTGDQRWDAQRTYYGTRYKEELEKAIEVDRERFGVIGQIQDSRFSDSESSEYTPGFDAIYNRDTFGG